LIFNNFNYNTKNIKEIKNRKNNDITMNKNNQEIYSYVESIANYEQKTTWCVIFDKNISFHEFFTILKQHSIDRRLKDTDTYWIHVMIFMHAYWTLMIFIHTGQ